MLVPTHERSVSVGPQGRDADYEERMARENQGLVHFAARKIQRSGCRVMDYEDLVGWGQFGLLTAIRRFKPELGFKFSTYALRAIFHAIQGGILYEWRSMGRDYGYDRRGRQVLYEPATRGEDGEESTEIRSFVLVDLESRIDEERRLKRKVAALIHSARSPMERKVVEALLGAEGSHGWQATCATKVKRSRQRVHQVVETLLARVARAESRHELKSHREVSVIRFKRSGLRARGMQHTAINAKRPAPAGEPVCRAMSR